MFYLIWRHWRTLKMDRQTHCFILYFTLLYFVLLDFILLNFTLLYFTLLYLTLLYFTLFYFTWLDFTLLDFTLLYLTLLYLTWLYFTLLDFTEHLSYFSFHSMGRPKLFFREETQQQLILFLWVQVPNSQNHVIIQF